MGTFARTKDIDTRTPKVAAPLRRCRSDGSELKLVAWGLRNAYGIASHPDGWLIVTEHEMDERGGRFIVGDPDDLNEIVEGAWAGRTSPLGSVSTTRIGVEVPMGATRSIPQLPSTSGAGNLTRYSACTRLASSNRSLG